MPEELVQNEGNDPPPASGRRRWKWLPWRWRRTPSVPLSLALQGGGAHGAFTWGVLDRLLEEPEVDVQGISGASAGAMNAAVCASGWLRGRHEGAREALHRFWESVSKSAQMGPLQPRAFDYLLYGWNRDWSPAYMMMGALTKIASPYQFNPGGFNPLVKLLNAQIDFEALRASRRLQLFIAVTNVHTGMLRVLRNGELSAEGIVASGCLPLLFQAVKLGNEHYWDGGYTANPPLFPVLFECPARDLLLVQLEPSWRDKVPIRVPEIVDRTNEIAFNANLMRELQLLALLERPSSRFPVPRGWFGGDPSRRLHVHHVEAEDAVEGAGRSSRMNAEWGFLLHLRDQGRARADAWLARHAADLGRRSSMDLARYL
jgi:NTE family protein